MQKQKSKPVQNPQKQLKTKEKKVAKVEKGAKMEKIMKKESSKKVEKTKICEQKKVEIEEIKFDPVVKVEMVDNELDAIDF